MRLLNRLRTFLRPPVSQPTRESQVHDYRKGHRGWGHDCTYRPDDNDPMVLHVTGWGRGIEEGDVMLFTGPTGGTSPYKVESLRYFWDPKDMWSMQARYIEGATMHDNGTGQITVEQA